MSNFCCCLPPEPKYNDYDWDELPEEARKAAETLGYTKKLWDKNKDPEAISDLDWDQLTAEQKEAATVLGYNKQAWDDED
jgi:hypothetical protein